MSMKTHDMTPRIDLTRTQMTGPVVRQRPRYVQLQPPCNHACPAGENIQAWLALAQAGQYRRAWEALIADNPLPAVHGRVCYHPCESECNRKYHDDAVGIHAVERFLGDMANREAWAPKFDAAASGKRVLIVGAGPSGLSAAYHLRRLGHDVEIHEAGPLAGGMLHFGIPAYRLPRDVLAREVAGILATGVRVIVNHKVEDLLAEQAAGGFDAVFVGIGTQSSKHVDIPARDATRVLDAVSLLHAVSTGQRPRLGRRAVIYGGGNTAMDAARTARRLGADETLIVYRRDREHMPAHAIEADEVLEEGIRIRWLTSIKEVIGPDLKVEIMELDDGGRPRPTGRFEMLHADSLVLALGQRADSTFLRKIPGVVLDGDGNLVVDAQMMTGHAGLFAGGDALGRERTVTVSVGHGKRAARCIDAWLRGQTCKPPAGLPLVRYDMLHLPVYSDADPAAQPIREVGGRIDSFDEIVGGLDERNARYEAQRCFSCGNCFECDQCYAACPEQAVIKLGPGRGYRIEESLCTGCAACFEHCPCHAIEMINEPR